MKYSGRAVHRSGGAAVHPEARWGAAVLAGMTDEQLAVLRGADRDAGEHNVPRLAVSSDGTVSSVYERGNTLYSDASPTGPVAEKAKAEVAATVAKL